MAYANACSSQHSITFLPASTILPSDTPEYQSFSPTLQTTILTHYFFNRPPNRLIRRYHSYLNKHYLTHSLIHQLSLSPFFLFFQSATPQQNPSSLPEYQNQSAFGFSKSHPSPALTSGSKFRQKNYSTSFSYYFISYPPHSRPNILFSRLSLSILRDKQFVLGLTGT